MPIGPILIVAMIAQAPQAVPAGWSLFTPKGGGFSVALPAKPTVKTVTRDGKEGPIERLEVLCEAAGCVYKIERSTMPRPYGKENEPAALDMVCKSFAAKASLKAEKAVEVQGHPGRDMLLEAPLTAGAKSSRIATRLVVADRDVFQISVFALEPGVEPKGVVDLVESFRLATKAGK